MGIFTSANNIALKKLRKIADQVIALETKYAPLGDDDLRAGRIYHERYAYHRDADAVVFARCGCCILPACKMDRMIRFL